MMPCGGEGRRGSGEGVGNYVIMMEWGRVCGEGG